MTRTKVLLAQADPQVASDLGQGLKRLGFEVVLAFDAISLLPLARREMPDAIVLDGKLPGGRAEQTLARIRGLMSTALIPVIFLLDGNGRREDLIASGAQECLTKPVGVEQLHRVVARHVGSEPNVERASRSLIEDPGRIEALEDSGLLDTAQEEVFDMFTRLASRLLSVPTTTFSLVGADRQFFKSHVGLHDSLTASRETPLSFSFCQHVVASDAPLMIDDARVHPLVRSNLAVRDLGVAAYIGTPIKTLDGHVIGSFCGIDSQPHRWSDEDLAIVILLGTIVAGEVERRRATSRTSPDHQQPTVNLLDSLRQEGASLLAITQLLLGRGNQLGTDDKESLSGISSAAGSALAHLIDSLASRAN